MREAVHVSATGATMTAANDMMRGADRQVGPAYQFAVATEPRSAVISFKVDPGKLAAAVGVPGATPAGLFIQIFEPALGSWIPLRSTYRPASQTVTATAPHLSLVSLTWTVLKCAVTCPAELLAKLVKRFTSDIVTDIKASFPPKQNHDQCTSEADKQWSVGSTIKQLSGCVIDSGHPPQAQVENPLLLPMTIRQPSGAPHADLTQQPYLGKVPELSSLITGLMDWASGATLIGPRDYAVLPLQDLTGVPRLTMLTQPDALALVMDVGQGVLFALPNAKSEDQEIEDAVREVLPEFETQMEKDPGSVSLHDILDAVEGNLAKQEAAAPGPALTLVRTISDLYDCASNAANAVVSVDSVESMNSAIEAGKTCAEDALEKVAEEVGKSYAEAVDLINGIPDFVTSIREGVQFAELGPSAAFGSTIATQNSAGRAKPYASASLTTSSRSIKAQVYFGQLGSIIAALNGQVTFSRAGLEAAPADLCTGTVVFSHLGAASGAVYAQGLGTGWTAAENAPSPDAQNGHLHQQIVVPPAGVSAGDSWQGSANLIAGNLQVQSGRYSLRLQGRNGTTQTWQLDGQTVTCGE